MKRLTLCLANSQSYFVRATRGAIFIVMAWIGGLKAFQYEADGIKPLNTLHLQQTKLNEKDDCFLPAGSPLRLFQP